MKRKIENYLNSKNKNEYSNLDKIFELYLSGDMKKLLSKYTRVKVYLSIDKLGKTFQLNYNYQNISVVVDFFEDKYSVVVYPPGINLNDLEKSFIDYEYQNNFNLEKLIKEIEKKIETNSKLKDTTLLEKRKKVYSIIARISFCFSILICGSMALYCVITERSVQGNIWWLVFFIVIPLIVWFIFDVKSKRLK